MGSTVKIRYIGPQTEGVWTDADAGAHDFVHGEYEDVDVALARELLERQEPVPPGEPVFDEEQNVWVTEMAPVWELAPGESVPGLETAAEPNKPAKAARATKASKGARR